MMTQVIQSIALDRLLDHPGSANRMSKVNFRKLVRNIGRTGLYEPLIVRVCRDKAGCFEIINGRHRREALLKLGYEAAHCVVWAIDDEQTDVFLGTLNRLAGRDEMGKKLRLLKSLARRLGSGELSKLVPHTKRQIERLISMLDARNSMLDACESQIENRKSKIMARPVVFFLDEQQHEMLEQALSMASDDGPKKPKADRRASALAQMAQQLVKKSAGRCCGRQ
ncbi:MAG: hypothetical protein ACYTEL_19555 [Planctomycetota bacterium]|jgi:ParB-like chromosome segregation protein Spo0J